MLIGLSKKIFKIMSVRIWVTLCIMGTFIFIYGVNKLLIDVAGVSSPHYRWLQANH